MGFISSSPIFHSIEVLRVSRMHIQTLHSDPYLLTGPNQCSLIQTNVSRNRIWQTSKDHCQNSWLSRSTLWPGSTPKLLEAFNQPANTFSSKTERMHRYQRWWFTRLWTSEIGAAGHENNADLERPIGRQVGRDRMAWQPLITCSMNSQVSHSHSFTLYGLMASTFKFRPFITRDSTRNCRSAISLAHRRLQRIHSIRAILKCYRPQIQREGCVGRLPSCRSRTAEIIYGQPRNSVMAAMSASNITESHNHNWLDTTEGRRPIHWNWTLSMKSF